MAQTFFPFACLVVGTLLAFFAISMEKLKKLHYRNDDFIENHLVRKRNLVKTINNKIQCRSIEELESIANSL